MRCGAASSGLGGAVARDIGLSAQTAAARRMKNILAENQTMKNARYLQALQLQQRELPSVKWRPELNVLAAALTPLLGPLSFLLA